MAYDEDLADRVRFVLGERGVGPVEEKRMFGGLAFMVPGGMAVAVTGSGGLMTRVAPDQAAPLSESHEHVEPMEMRGRASRTWVHVLPAGLRDDGALTGWVDRGLASVAALEG